MSLKRLLPDTLLPVVKLLNGTPTTINDGPLARRINAAFVRELGAAAVTPWEQTDIGAEDFAYLVTPALKIPGVYFAVGGTPQAAFDAEKAGGSSIAGHHSGLFKIDAKASIVTGATAMTVAVMELLGKTKP